MHSEYPIIKWKFLIHEAGQTELGKRRVSVKAVEQRPSGLWPTGDYSLTNRLRNPDIDPDMIEKLAATAAGKALDVFKETQNEENDLFVSDCKWGYDSKGNVSFDVEVSFVGKK